MILAVNSKNYTSALLIAKKMTPEQRAQTNHQGESAFSIARNYKSDAAEYDDLIKLLTHNKGPSRDGEKNLDAQ